LIGGRVLRLKRQPVREMGSTSTSAARHTDELTGE
jgi:hypothetical protein